jgi:uncharacterized protein with PQ loop repeat
MFSKYFNFLTDASFTKDNNGNTLFLPWGIFGKGRIIADELIERKVRSFIILYYKVSLPTIIFTIVVFGGIWSFVLTPLLMGWFYLATKSLLSGCQYSEEKFYFRENLMKSAKKSNKSTLWLLLLGSFLFVIGGIVVLIIAKSTSDILASVSSIVFFGACTILYAYMLSLKKT